MTTSTRLPLALRAGYGLFLLAAPERLLATGRARRPSWSSGIVRLLGARHVLQAAALAAVPQLARPGALVDLAHASTDVVCAVRVRSLRTPALLDTAVATALALSSSSVSPRRYT